MTKEGEKKKRKRPEEEQEREQRSATSLLTGPRSRGFAGFRPSVIFNADSACQSLTSTGAGVSIAFTRLVLGWEEIFLIFADYNRHLASEQPPGPLWTPHRARSAARSAKWPI